MKCRPVELRGRESIGQSTPRAVLAIDSRPLYRIEARALDFEHFGRLVSARDVQLDSVTQNRLVRFDNFLGKIVLRRQMPEAGPGQPISRYEIEGAIKDDHQFIDRTVEFTRMRNPQLTLL